VTGGDVMLLDVEGHLVAGGDVICLDIQMTFGGWP
jgi:hypothetical protein